MTVIHAVGNTMTGGTIMKTALSKKLASVGLSLLITAGSISIGAVADLAVSAAEVDASEYSYSITPLLAPFNNYFFVETDNPDPNSFRFVDPSSVYHVPQGADDTSMATVGCIYIRYADINYDDRKTGRVNGGYIFSSSDTDGGELVLQKQKKSDNWWESGWEDTEMKFTLPALIDECDYLISNFADKNSFFENMSAVQRGFESVCLYSGSYIRGDLVRDADYWFLSNSPHVDQLFYLQSPYNREDNESLFASAIYPFRYDSIGFPSVMGAVAYRLDNSSTCEWNSEYHWLIDVTCNGVTRSYGGAGEGKGQGIEKENIKQFFTFGKNGTEISLESIRELLEYYSKLDIADDVPTDDAPTWHDIWETAGNGAWIRLVAAYSIFGGSGEGYSYVWQSGEGTEFYTDVTSTGTQLYWFGDLEIASDIWIDGRYINSHEVYEPGAVLEDHPHSKLLLRNVTVPEVKVSYDTVFNYEEYRYEYPITDVSVKLKKKDKVIYYYDEDRDLWTLADYYAGFEYASVDDIFEFIESGRLDEKYADMITLTNEQVKALRPDRNTNKKPKTGYIYDCSDAPGTPYTLVPLTDSRIKLTLSSTVFNADGKVKLPEVKLTDNGKVLKENKDYYIEYSEPYSKAPGKYTLTVVSMGNYSGKLTRSYNIYTPADSLSLSEKTVSLRVGEKFTLAASTEPAEAVESVVWSSSDPKVAKVTNGVVKGIGKGSAVIKAKTSNGKVAVCRVYVGMPLTNNLTLSASSIMEGKSVTVKCAAVGGSSPYKYSVLYRKTGTAKWKTAQAFGTGDSIRLTFNKAGEYEIKVKTKDAKGKTVSSLLKLKVKKPLTNRSVLSTDTIAAGERVKIRGFADGGSGGYQFAFYCKKANGTKWTRLRDYAEGNIMLYKPKSAADYVFRVYVKDSSGKKVVKELALSVKK